MGEILPDGSIQGYSNYSGKSNIQGDNLDKNENENIKLLCDKVLETNPIYEYNSNSYDSTICPFCKEFEYGANGTMNGIIHEKDCAFILAKEIIEKL